MNTRTGLTLALLAGTTAAASAQELIRVTYSWVEVQAGTVTPVAAPNSIVDPGEGARISLHREALINGTNAVGQTTIYTTPPPPGFGTVRGLAGFIYNLRGDNGASTAAGAWGPRSVAGGGFTGNVLLDGALLDSFGGGQFVAPGGSAISTNPVNNSFRGVWTPASYTPREVRFKAEPGTAAPAGQHNGILLAYSIEQPNPNDPTTWYDNLYTKFIGSDFGSGVDIPIAPAPSTALILALAALPTPRARRKPAS